MAGSERAERACDRSDGGRGPEGDAVRSEAEDRARSANPEEDRPGARSAEGIAQLYWSIPDPCLVPATPG